MVQISRYMFIELQVFGGSHLFRFGCPCPNMAEDVFHFMDDEFWPGSPTHTDTRSRKGFGNPVYEKGIFPHFGIERNRIVMNCTAIGKLPVNLVIQKINRFDP